MHTPKVIIHRLHASIPARRPRRLPTGLLRSAAMLAGSAVVLLAVL